MKANNKTLKLCLKKFKVAAWACPIECIQEHEKLGRDYKFEVSNYCVENKEILIENLFSKNLTDNDLTNLYLIREAPNGLEFRVKDYHDDTILRFFLQDFPGCCEIQVIRHVYICPGKRGYGLSYDLLDMAKALSKWFGCTILIGTVSTEEPTMNKILKKRDEWKVVKNFKNNRTGNKIHMWLTEIKY